MEILALMVLLIPSCKIFETSLFYSLRFSNVSDNFRCPEAFKPLPVSSPAWRNLFLMYYSFCPPYIHCHGFGRLYSSSQVFSLIAILLSPNSRMTSQNMLHGSSCNTYNWNTCGKDTNWNLPEQMLFFQSKFTTWDLMCLDVSLNA